MEQVYYVHIDGQQSGPYSLSQLRGIGITHDTMIWRSDLPNWVQAATLPEVVEIINVATPPPHGSQQVQQPYTPQESVYPQQQAFPQQQYGPQYPHPQQPYQYGGGNGMLPAGWVNWKGWAIAGTIVGIFSCCLGWIFGLIGVIRATEANTFAKAGMMEQAQEANKSAKTMTLVSVIIGGISLLVIMIYWVALGTVFTALIDNLYSTGMYDY